MSPVMWHMSRVVCHVSHVMCHLSPVVCHLTTTLCSFSCYKSPRRLGDADLGGLVIYRVKYPFFLQEKEEEKNLFLAEQFKEYPLRPEVSIPLSIIE